VAFSHFVAGIIFAGESIILNKCDQKAYAQRKGVK
jgi:hypothetical protein